MKRENCISLVELIEYFHNDMLIKVKDPAYFLIVTNPNTYETEIFDTGSIDCLRDGYFDVELPDIYIEDVFKVILDNIGAYELTDNIMRNYEIYEYGDALYKEIDRLGECKSPKMEKIKEAANILEKLTNAFAYNIVQPLTEDDLNTWRWAMY